MQELEYAKPSRALGEVGQTRTWNLMLDVIAQSGRYPPNANSLAGFMVEGEQRDWVHPPSPSSLRRGYCESLREQAAWQAWRVIASGDE
jgi:hypothetical protein